MHKMILFYCLLVFSIFLGCKTANVPIDHMGTYQLSDGTIVSIRKSTDGTLRYRIFQNGESGRLHPNGPSTYVSGAGFSARHPEELRIEFLSQNEKEKQMIWEKINSKRDTARAINKEEWISFTNNGITLHARVNLPLGQGPFPAVVLVHGSGKDAATEYYYNGDFFASQGIAALTFDKRGTGMSEGEYTFDYDKLASDVIAAVNYIATRPDIDTSKIGLTGYSQGGWVAPLAASQSDMIKFVIVNYGMIESAIEEARLETRNTLRDRGVSEPHLMELDELTLATVNVVASGFKSGWKEARKINKKYKNAPWRKKLKGTTVHQFLKYPNWLIKLIGPGKAPYELDWEYESTVLLHEFDKPIAWLLAAEDSSAPNELTIPKIRNFQKTGKPFYLKIFPKSDHTMLLFEETNGERIYTQYTPDYFASETQIALKLINLQSTIN